MYTRYIHYTILIVPRTSIAVVLKHPQSIHGKFMACTCHRHALKGQRENKRYASDGNFKHRMQQLTVVHKNSATRSTDQLADLFTVTFWNKRLCDQCCSHPMEPALIPPPWCSQVGTSLNNGTITLAIRAITSQTHVLVFVCLTKLIMLILMTKTI